MFQLTSMGGFEPVSQSANARLAVSVIEKGPVGVTHPALLSTRLALRLYSVSLG